MLLLSHLELWHGAPSAWVSSVDASDCVLTKPGIPLVYQLAFACMQDTAKYNGSHDEARRTLCRRKWPTCLCLSPFSLEKARLTVKFKKLCFTGTNPSGGKTSAGAVRCCAAPACWFGERLMWEPFCVEPFPDQKSVKRLGQRKRRRRGRTDWERLDW